MKKKNGSDPQTDDLRLLALLVANRLRQEHLIEDVPATGAYRIADSKFYLQAGKEVRVDVDLGEGLTITIYHVWWGDTPDLEQLMDSAEQIADKIAESLQDCEETRAMIAEVASVARREIAKARRRGLPYKLMSVTLPPLAAGCDDQSVARVEHLALGRSLQLERFAVHAECGNDVALAFESIADEQAQHVHRRARLDEIGATGTIDSVVVAAIGAAGLDLPHVLTTMRDADDPVVDFDVADGTCLTLHWDAGAVRAHIDLGEGVNWHKGKLWFGRAEQSLKPLSKGSALNKLYEHPFLSDRIRILKDYSPDRGSLFVSCNEAMLNFDADSGRLWAA